MTKTFDEQYLRFEFDDEWQVTKYDSHRDYQKIQEQTGAKGVDFVGLTPTDGDRLYLVEVKDFRGYRIENKRRVKDSQLALEVAQKVRDTLAGIVGAYRASSEPEVWQAYARYLANAAPPLYVVLWLEEDLSHTPQERSRQKKSILGNQLKQRLKWLTTRVLVESISSSQLPDVVVKSLSRTSNRT